MQQFSERQNATTLFRYYQISKNNWKTRPLVFFFFFISSIDKTSNRVKNCWNNEKKRVHALNGRGGKKIDETFSEFHEEAT